MPGAAGFQLVSSYWPWSDISCRQPLFPMVCPKVPVDSKISVSYPSVSDILSSHTSQEHCLLSLDLQAWSHGHRPCAGSCDSYRQVGLAAGPAGLLGNSLQAGCVWQCFCVALSISCHTSDTHCHQCNLTTYHQHMLFSHLNFTVR